jgi:WXG100 family type VII secretion target
MAAETTAQTAAMAQAAIHVDNAGQAIATIRNQVADAVGATSGGYVTEAATLFRNVMDQWGQDFGTIIAGLESIKEKLTGTTANYKGAMDIDSQSANQIAALLNGNDV